jgi:nucleoside 2-deoxyribosyltransferase
VRIYVAGPWVDREQVIPIAKQLENIGHVITHEWWKYDGESQNNEPPSFLAQCAQADVDGVKTADVVIVYNSSKSEGKSVEQGIAIANNKPIVCITPGDIKPSSNIFHYLPNYQHVKSVEAALEVIGGF